MNKLLPITCLALLLLTFACSLATAQSVIPPSPEASSLLKYANVPVNSSTGVPEIDLPLVEVQGRSLSAQVSLSYHAGGIKVQDVAGSVGLGWTLQGGGVVTRTVRGLPDDDPNGYSGENQRGLSVNQEDILQYEPEYLHAVGANIWDGEPDLFYFNVQGRTGRFVLDAEGKPVLMPYQNILITYNSDESGLTGWTIKLEDGTTYLFGSDENALETTESIATREDGSTKTTSHISSWYLTEINTPGNDEAVNFSYQSGGDMSYTYYRWVEVREISKRGDCNRDLRSGVLGLNTDITVKSPKYLSKIQTTLGSIDFIYGEERFDVANGLALSKIHLKNVQDKLLREIDLTYSYFGGGAARLKLEKVTDNTSTTVLSMYRFDYNTAHLLPPRSYPYFDHWGYFSDTKLASFIPAGCDEDGNCYSGASRESDPERMKANVLTKITNATSGCTEFEYEPHRFVIANDEGGTEEISGGGLRIKRITEHSDDYPQSDVIKTFSYQLGTSQYSLPEYTSTSNNIERAGRCAFRVFRRYSHSITELFDLNGLSLGYKSVTENFSDGSSIQRKYTNFVSHPDQTTDVFAKWCYFTSINGYPFGGCNELNMDQIMSPYPPSTYFGWKRGQLIEAIHKSAGGKKVKREVYHYQFDTDIKKSINGLVVQENMYDIKRYTFSFFYGQYEVISQPYFLDYKIEEVYDQDNESNYVSTRTDYEYDPTYLQVKKETTTDSEGAEWTTSYRYPTDYIQTLNDRLFRVAADSWGPLDPPEVSGVLGLLLSHQHSQVLETTQRRQRVGESNAQVVAGSLNLFHLTDEDDPRSSSRLAQSLTLSLGEPLTTTEAFTITPRGDELLNPPIFSPPTAEPYLFSYDTHYEPEQTFVAYDKDGNLLQSTARDNVSTSQLYSYENSLPIAQAVGAAHNQIAYTGFEAPDESTLSLGFLNDRDGNFKWKHKDASFHTDAHTGRRSYSGSEIICEDLPAGRYRISCWAKRKADNDKATVYFGSPSSAKEAGADWTYLSWTLTTENGVSELPIYSNGNLIDEVRIHPVDAQMTTYTYDPLVGVTSETDVNNVTTYYEYDELNRLRLVKDQHRDIRQRYQYVYKTTE